MTDYTVAAGHDVERDALARAAAERLRDVQDAMRQYRRALHRAREAGVTMDDLERAKRLIGRGVS